MSRDHRFDLLVASSALLAIAGALLAPGALLLHYLFKPLTTILLLVLVWRSPDPHGFRPWVMAGLVFSTLGDIALMLPVDAFVIGLGAFLLAHLAYIAAFARRAAAIPVAWGALLYAALAAGVLALLLPAVPAELRWPVIAYALVLAAMAATALGASSIAGRRLALGGALFVLSDGLLAWNRFVEPLPLASLWVLASYWAAQWCIARSVAGGRGSG